MTSKIIVSVFRQCISHVPGILNAFYSRHQGVPQIPLKRVSSYNSAHWQLSAQSHLALQAIYTPFLSGIHDHSWARSRAHFSDAVAHPRAMVVKLPDAIVTDCTVRATRRSVVVACCTPFRVDRVPIHLVLFGQPLLPARAW